MVRKVQVMLLRTLCVLTAFVFVHALTGCGGGDGLVEVTGTVKTEDGSVPKAQMMSINFQPEDTKLKTPSASIDPQDGSFKLKVDGIGDGAYPGKYTIEVNLIEDYNKSSQPKRPKVEPSTVEIKKGEANKFEFKIKK
jgi:hypothetical protein